MVIVHQRGLRKLAETSLKKKTYWRNKTCNFLAKKLVLEEFAHTARTILLCLPEI